MLSSGEKTGGVPEFDTNVANGDIHCISWLVELPS